MPEIPTPRTCAAIGCARPIEPRYLFCEVHRARLPCPALVEIRRSCRPGSAGADRPTRAWISAVARAVEILAESEGRPPANRFSVAISAISPGSPA